MLYKLSFLKYLEVQEEQLSFQNDKRNQEYQMRKMKTKAEYQHMLK